MKKMLSLIIVTFIILGLLTGCGEKPTKEFNCTVNSITATQIIEKKEVITVYEVSVTTERNHEYKFYADNYDDFKVGDEIICLFEGKEHDRGVYYNEIIDAYYPED